jgi:hypothetical protein
MKKGGIKLRVVATVAALSLGLASCEGMIADVCGERPVDEFSDEYTTWKGCRDRVVTSGAILGLIIIAGVAIGVAASGDGGDDGGGGTD